MYRFYVKIQPGVIPDAQLCLNGFVDILPQCVGLLMAMEDDPAALVNCSALVSRYFPSDLELILQFIM
jgi:hypothetical protein